ncbi:hypothetical protein CEP53_003509 [Fusarium sp. AF-6]|nr:hypothetical protein CEP53_003509 [Fusarium sp. AF-6]
METGDQDLDPRTLGEVMALSVGDSIYSLSTLFSDPHTEPQTVLSDNISDTKGTCIVHTFGNLGKYGISLLIPPPELKIRKLDYGQWNVINHGVWDSTTADSFGEISLHLFLTEYRVPYTTDHHGNRDIQAFFFQEAATLGRRSHVLLRVPKLCKHDVVGSKGRPPLKRQEESQEESFAKDISCVDSWCELMDKPDRPVHVRSRGN